MSNYPSAAVEPGTSAPGFGPGLRRVGRLLGWWDELAASVGLEGSVGVAVVGFEVVAAAALVAEVSDVGELAGDVGDDVVDLEIVDVAAVLDLADVLA